MFVIAHSILRNAQRQTTLLASCRPAVPPSSSEACRPARDPARAATSRTRRQPTLSIATRFAIRRSNTAAGTRRAAESTLLSTACITTCTTRCETCNTLVGTCNGLHLTLQ
eukprot:594853-Prymnesium_polylepis.1